MIIFSTILPMKDTFTKEVFIDTLIKWNQNSPFEDNKLSELNYGMAEDEIIGRDFEEDAKGIKMSINEYKNKNIIYARYSKTGDDGIIWNSDFVYNMDENKLSVQLDRSFEEGAELPDREFSSPYFVSLIIDEGYVLDDNDLPISRMPRVIKEADIDFVADIINEKKTYRLPVVIISKAKHEETPLDTVRLIKNLKGVAHVLELETCNMATLLKDMTGGKNPYGGKALIVYPKQTTCQSMVGYRKSDRNSNPMISKITKSITEYTMSQAMNPLYTWQGVDNALTLDKLASQRMKRQAAENMREEAEEAARVAQRVAKDAKNAAIEAENAAKVAENLRVNAENEVLDVYDAFDDELKSYAAKIEQLTKENERLMAENYGLQAKLGNHSEKPLLLFGDEDDLYHGEIKDIILSILDEQIRKNIKAGTRRYDVVKDVLDKNIYEHINEGKEKDIKRVLSTYTGMSKPERKILEDVGFIITEEGKHYKLSYYGDERYWSTLGKTPSEGRGGKNEAGELILGML